MAEIGRTLESVFEQEPPELVEQVPRRLDTHRDDQHEQERPSVARAPLAQLHRERTDRPQL
jgi:hypothetical protein